jgi:cobalt-zinc-cadmium efflux system protein
VARRPASPRHSYGLRRIETLAGLINGLSMLPVVALIGWHAVDRLIDPQPVQGDLVMVVAGIGLAVNLVVAWMLSRGTGDMNTRGALLHVMGDALGSVAALASGVVIHYTGWYPIDALLSLLICALILVSTFGLLRTAAHMLLEGVPEALSLPDVGRAMAEVAGVRSVHDLHIWSLDSNHVALSAHVVLRHGGEWPRVLAALRAVLHSRFDIDHVTLQPETLPDEPITFARRRAPQDADTR